MRILAVILVYHPELAVLQRLSASILQQTEGTLIVDNGSQWNREFLLGAIANNLRAQLHFLRLHENVGVAAGHNRGIAWAREHEFSHVLLMDQDSIPAPDMVEKLANELTRLTREGVRVAGVGPQCVDAYTGKVSAFVRFGRFSLKRVKCSPEQESKAIEVDFLISSGLLIPMRVIEEVGLMDEALFIDHVDTEWLNRAKHRGYRVFGVCGAVMRHSLGNASLNFWFLRWRTIPLHNPERHYYVFRNSLVLLRRSNVPRQWIINDIVRLIYMAVFYPLFAPPRGQRIKFMLKGVWHGLHGIQGPLR